MLRYFSLLLLGLSATATAGAADEKTVPGDDAAKKVTYEDHVKPIFREHCFSCHNQADAKGGLALDSFASLMEGGGSGEIVYDGDAASSRLWMLINHEDTPEMPPNQDKLAAEKLAVVEAWINGGLLENSGSKAKAKKVDTLAFAGSTAGKPEGPAAMPEGLTLQPVIATSRPAAATAIAASPWAPLVAIAGQQQVLLYHTDSGELLGVLPFPEGIAHSIRFSRDGAFLIVGGGAHASLGIVAVYNVKTGERIAQVGDELDVVLSGDVNENMSRIALGGPQRMLRIYNVADGELLFDIKKHTDWIYAVAYSPDGVLLASGDRSAGLVVWEAETGRPYLELTDHKGAINALAWRDDSNVLASASDDGTVKLWDMFEGKVVRSITAHAGGVMAVAFDHQGRLVTAGKDKRVKLWDAAGKELRAFPAMEQDVLEVTITHDGGQVIAGDWTGKIVAWNSEKPETNRPLPANPPTLQQRLERAQQQLTATVTKRTEAEKAAAAAAEQTKQATAARDQLKQQQQQLAEAAAKLQQQVDAAAAQIKTLEQQRDALAAQVQQHQKQTATVTAEVKDKPAEEGRLAEAERALAKVLTDLAASRDQAVKARAEHGQLAAELKKQTDERTKLDAPLKAAETKLAELTKAQQVAGEAFKQAEQAHQAALAEVQRWQTAVAQLSAEQPSVTQTGDQPSPADQAKK